MTAPLPERVRDRPLTDAEVEKIATNWERLSFSEKVLLSTLRHDAATITALRAENARLTSEVERLEAKFQQNFGCHHSWVRDHAEHRRLLSEVERLRVVVVAARAFAAQYPWQGAPEIAPLIAALDAAGGEGKR